MAWPPHALASVSAGTLASLTVRPSLQDISGICPPSDHDLAPSNSPFILRPAFMRGSLDTESVIE
jgi:hypothetical protein